MMKRILASVLAIFLALSLGACGKKAGESSGTSAASAPTQSESISESESIEQKLTEVVTDNYKSTTIDKISVTKNTGEESGLNAQANLTWNTEDTEDRTNRTLADYSKDFASRVSKEAPNVTKCSISWSVPNFDSEEPVAEYSYERKGGAMQQTDCVISDKLGGAPPTDTDTGEETSGGSSDENSDLSTTMTAVESMLKSGFQSNYTLEFDQKTVTIGVWSEGVASGAVSAKNGDKNSLNAWKTLVSAMRGLSTSVRYMLKGVGHEEMTVTVSTVNDENKDNVLLTVVNGAVTYNWVEPDQVSQPPAPTEGGDASGGTEPETGTDSTAEPESKTGENPSREVDPATGKPIDEGTEDDQTDAADPSEDADADSELDA